MFVERVRGRNSDLDLPENTIKPKMSIRENC